MLNKCLGKLLNLLSLIFTLFLLITYSFIKEMGLIHQKLLEDYMRLCFVLCPVHSNHSKVAIIMCMSDPG